MEQLTLVGTATILIVFYATIAFAMVSDFRFLIIPNWVSILIAILFLPAAILGEFHISAIAVHYGMGLAIFIVGAILHYFRLFGGGDVKMLAAIAVWTGVSTLGGYLFLVAMFGGVLAIMVLVAARFQDVPAINAIPWLKGAAGQQTQLPYGIAIGIAAYVLSYLDQGFVININKLLAHF